MLQWSALEVLVAGIEGRRKSILQQFEEGQGEALLGELRGVLQRYGLQDEAVRRVTARMQDAQEENTAAWLSARLRKAGIEVDEAALRKAAKQRGAVTHSGTGTTEELSRAAGEVRHWVQTALRSVLQRRSL